MCGIAGFFSKNIVIHDDLIFNMIDKLNHRGPDNLSIWVNESRNFGFGHARLSILDTSSAGNQPMFSNSKRFVISFNGEIYNHLKLREELLNEEFSIKFKSGSDTETLLYCFESWSINKTLEKLTGMFSLALYDTIENKLFLARDRFGEKPLYYGWQNNNLYFSSELKSIVANSNFKKEINNVALSNFFNLSYIPCPLTIYNNINKLKPGTFVEISFNNIDNEIISHEYWNLHSEVLKSSNNKFLGTELEAIELLDQKLTNSVESQQISDVPIGAFLSGGIDSSLIVSIMQNISKKPINTFTIGFNESIYNEAQYANAISKYLGTNHNELYVNQKDIFEIIPKISTIYDEPFADSSQIPTYLVSKLAKEKVSVVLSGDAGDELFGGYNRYTKVLDFNKKNIFYTQISNLLLSLKPSQLEFLYKIFNPLLPKNFKSSNPVNHLMKIANLINTKNDWELFNTLIKTGDGSRILKQKIYSNSSVIKSHFEKLDNSYDLTNKMMYTDTLTYLTDDILTKVDRASMSVSLETRVPFLDHRIVSYAWSLPMNLKIRNGEGKWISKQLLKRYIPNNLIDRPKMGFGLPIDIWLRSILKDWALSLLNENDINKSEILDYDYIRDIWNQHQQGKKNYQFDLWNILMFRMWEEKWMK